jgi:uncharacterized membrane protein
MFQRLIKYKKLNESFLLGFLSVFCCFLSLIRMYFAHNKVFFFLNWNLFLAFLPWFFSTILIIYPKFQRKLLIIVVVIPLWLVFFPNAPYILTDLFHLRIKTSIPKWYDLILILTFAWTGLLFGFYSLFDIKLLLNRLIRPLYVNMIISLLLFISGFGIYLGRYLRWNSWDIISNPFGLLSDVSDRIINPLDHRQTWAITLMMGFFLNIVFWSIQLMKKNYHNSESTFLNYK